MSALDIVCVIIIAFGVMNFWYTSPLFAGILLACGAIGLYQSHCKKQKNKEGKNG